MGLESRSANEAIKNSLGASGHQTITAADGAVTGEFMAIFFETDTVISALTLASNCSGAAALVAIASHPANVTKIWRIRSITLTSGTATLYKE